MAPFPVPVQVLVPDRPPDAQGNQMPTLVPLVGMLTPEHPAGLPASGWALSMPSSVHLRCGRPGPPAATAGIDPTSTTGGGGPAGTPAVPAVGSGRVALQVVARDHGRVALLGVAVAPAARQAHL